MNIRATSKVVDSNIEATTVKTHFLFRSPYGAVNNNCALVPPYKRHTADIPCGVWGTPNPTSLEWLIDKYKIQMYFILKWILEWCTRVHKGTQESRDLVA